MPAWEVALRIVGTLFALGLVCLLAFLALRWMNRLQPGFSSGAKRHIRVLDRIATGKNQSLLLVRVQNTVLLLALSEHAAAKLAEFSADSGFDASDSAPPPSFSSVLKDAAAKAGLSPFGRRGKNGEAGEGGPHEE